jgi:hypothetical protein
MTSLDVQNSSNPIPWSCVRFRKTFQKKIVAEDAMKEFRNHVKMIDALAVTAKSVA